MNSLPNPVTYAAGESRLSYPVSFLIRTEIIRKRVLFTVRELVELASQLSTP